MKGIVYSTVITVSWINRCTVILQAEVYYYYFSIGISND